MMMVVVVMMMMMMMMSVCKCRQVGKGSLDDWKREREGEPSTTSAASIFIYSETSY